MRFSNQPAYFLWLTLFWVAALISACVPQTRETTRPTQTGGDVADAALAQMRATAFLSAWQEEDYAAMYAMLSPLSQDALSLDEFVRVYEDFANTLTLQSLNFELSSSFAQTHHAEVAYRVDFTTRLVGTLSREIVMKLTYGLNEWRVQWEPGLILPELNGENRLDLVREIPSRGRIFDRQGAPLAAYENAIAIGLVPGEILPEQAALIYETLAEISFYEVETLTRMVEATPADWYLPVITLSPQTVTPYIDTLRALKGVRLDEFRSRFYLDGGVAPHAVGYRLFIPEESLEDYLRLGYRQDELVGAAGLEAAYEAELSGLRGGSLYLLGADGKIQSLLASSKAQPGQSLVTTLDKTLQMQLQASMGEKRGAVVVMEVDTGRILALVSNPHFDPNAFDLSEIDRSLLESYFTNPDQPLFNRATQGQYPLGSVFKVISMAAALETDLYRAGSSFYCGHSLWVCERTTLYDWTYAHGQAPSGEISLTEGLMRSCNPWFYRIGESLFNEGMESELTEFARGFGLGAKTGIEIPEAAGNIPETADTCVNNAQIAIGQGEVLVTPLQVVTYFAALANGGTLYRPALVERIQPPSGEPVQSFVPQTNGQLPVSEGTMEHILEGLRLAVEERGGTGFWAMQGLDVPVSGKTGTAETPTGTSHAWFAGFSRQNDPERPDIAVVVIVENGGEGSAMAAPVFRRAVSLYFSDYLDPAGLMPWEVEPFVPFQPTPTTTAESPSGE